MTKPLTVQEFLFAAKDWPTHLFAPQELFRSQAALEQDFSNLPTLEQVANVRQFVQVVLRPLRMLWGGPIVITSCHRSAQTNMAVGGVPDSYHLSNRGAAADVATATGSLQGTQHLFQMLAGAGHIPFAEAILYFQPHRIHIGWDVDPAKNVRQLLVKTKNGYEPWKGAANV